MAAAAAAKKTEQSEMMTKTERTAIGEGDWLW